MLRNDSRRYGAISILLHWTMAALLVFQFLLGDFIVGLDYGHRWYLAAPDLHRGLGVSIGALLLLRLGWRLANPHPALPGPPWQQWLARQVHRSFYLLIATVVVSGYLISTASGQPIEVFGLIGLPATIHGHDQQEEIAGTLHRWSSWALMGLALLHSGAALKHHFIDHDATLRRMLSTKRRD